MNKTMSVHDKAIRLIEGGHVEQDGVFVRAIEVFTDDDACYLCDMDSLCHNSMSELCRECDLIADKKYLLKLVNKK